MQLQIAAHALRDFTRAITCLTKFGDDIDFVITPALLKLSTVNSARSAFCVFNFEPGFFSTFVVGNAASNGFSINAKALLSPLKTRSAASIESVTMSLIDQAPEDEGDATEVGGNEYRLVVRLNCKHGVIKTRRLTYTAASSLYARASRDDCPSSWIVSSIVLKEWVEHFSVQSGSGNAAATSEIAFAMTTESCHITSTIQEEVAYDDAHFRTRPTTTQITIDVHDFDEYTIVGDPAIQLALKEFKAIIYIADALSTSITAAFWYGGQPILLDIAGELFTADFVIATSAFYDEHGDQIGQIEPKAESEQPRAGTEGRDDSPAFNLAERTPARFDVEGNAIAGPSGSRNGRPLFDKSTPAPPADEDEDEYGDSFVDFGEADFSAIDLLSQAASSKQKSVGAEPAPKKKKKELEMLVLDSEDGPEEEVLILEEDDDFTFGTRGGATADTKMDEEEEEGEEEEQYDHSQGPTKKSKKEWNLFGN